MFDPRSIGLLSDHWMIEPLIGAQDEAMQSRRSDFKPNIDAPAVAGKVRENLIVIGKRCGWDLMPTGTVEVLGRNNCFRVAQHEFTVSQPRYLEGHFAKHAKVAIRGRQRLR